MTITSRKDLEFAYNFRRWLRETRPGNKATTDALIKDMSVAIHRYNREQEETRIANSDRRIVKDYGIDGYVLRIDMLDDFVSISEARAWFEEYEYIHYVPTYYDCTGQMFTRWYSLFRHPDGHIIVYHSVGCDC